MVMNDEGQLYTIEGITAGVIMLITAFTIFNTGVVYTPGDAHISDMQIQQLGYDALLMMDTPDENAPLSESDLAKLVRTDNGTDFDTLFLSYLTAGTGTTDIVDSLEYNATVYNRVASGTGGMMYSHAFSHSADSAASQVTREPAISVSRYVWLSDANDLRSHYGAAEYDNDEQLVLLEVLIWRR